MSKKQHKLSGVIATAQEAEQLCNLLICENEEDFQLANNMMEQGRIRLPKGTIANLHKTSKWKFKSAGTYTWKRQRGWYAGYDIWANDEQPTIWISDRIGNHTIK